MSNELVFVLHYSILKTVQAKDLHLVNTIIFMAEKALNE